MTRRATLIAGVHYQCQSVSVTRREPFQGIWRQIQGYSTSRVLAPMTLQVVSWLLLGCWALAVFVAVARLAFDVLAADSRGAKLPAGWLPSVVRTCVRCGVVFTIIVVLSTIFKTIDDIWIFSLEPLSYRLTAYSGSVKQAVIAAGFFICFLVANRAVDSLLNKFLPNGPADRIRTAENSNHKG